MVPHIAWPQVRGVGVRYPERESADAVRHPVPARPCEHGRLRPALQGRVRAHLAECEGCLEEYDVDVVVKTIVRRGCQEAAPDGLRLKIHEQLTVMRVTRD